MAFNRNNVRSRTRLIVILALASLTGLAPAVASGQSITRGSLEGTVADGAGRPLAGALVWVTDPVTGVNWRLVAGEKGDFRLPLLAPGEYVVVAEEIGYRPRRIEGVPVRPGRRQHVSLALETVQLPVDEIENVRFAEPAEASRAGASQWFSPFSLLDLPETRRELAEVARLSSVSDPELGSEGLPGGLSRVAIDGLPYAAARHPDLPLGGLTSAAFPLSSVEHAELITHGLDVEWAGAAGAILSGHSRRGSGDPQFRFYGDWLGSSLSTSDHFDPGLVARNSFRAGAVVSGPVIPDTAHFVVGVEAQRLETPLPRPWEISELDAALTAVAADSFAVDIGPVVSGPRAATSDLVSGFGRLDWQISGGHSLGVRANAAALKVAADADELPDLGPRRIASLGSEVVGWDVSIAATLASQLGGVVSHEARASVDRTERDYRGASMTGTRIVDGGLAFGTDPAVPGEFINLAVRGSETLHFRLPRHQLKLGVAGSVHSVEQRYAYARGGEYIFAGVDEFGRLEGVFSQASGSTPFAQFTNWGLGFFLQDTWAAAPGLELLVGLRYDFERLDRDEIRRNLEWQELTGIDNTAFDRNLDKLSARFGFLWDPSQRSEWLVRGGWGVHHGMADATLFGEAVTFDGPVSFRRGVGDLGSWPNPPDLAAAPVQGPRLTLLGAEFRAPRTARGSLGLSRLFGAGTGVHLSGVYRHTDYLPRRHDINRPLAAGARDQHGRPISGSLIKQGSLVTVAPGTNRRFPEFDLVSALDVDGTSEYVGGTVMIERHAGAWLDLIASYTLSRTRDDVLPGLGGGPEAQLTPFPEGGAGEDWADGTSDFDIPHRLVLGAQLKLPAAAGVRLAGLYRLRSGEPFTPGFREGVDVNGDGSGSNDPAFIDPAVPGMDALLAKWDCLAGQVQKFAERNSCRAPAVHRVDVRFALGLYEVQKHPIEIVVDALDLLDSDSGIRDRAVYLIDREADLATGTDGTITLPLVTNPNFGEPLVRRSTGRSFRFGIRVGL